MSLLFPSSNNYNSVAYMFTWHVCMPHHVVIANVEETVITCHVITVSSILLHKYKGVACMNAMFLYISITQSL